jgi:tetratricopeptide (TPR) repeat protein
LLNLVLLLLAANDPKQAETLLRHGLAELQQDRLTAARQDFEAASRIDSKNPYVWASLAQTYWRLADKPGALRAAQSAERHGTGNANVAHMLTIFYSEAGDLKRAASFERAYALSNVADPDALSRAASLSLAAGDIPEALTYAQRAVDRNASPANQNLLGRVQIAAGQPDGGVANLSAAWTADRQNEQFCFDYAQALLHRGDFTASADVVSEGLSTHPKSSQLQLALGVARYGQRRFEDAIESFLKTIQRDPSVEQPYVFLGRMLDQAGPRLAEITKDYQVWNRKQPSNYQSSFLLAKALVAGGGEPSIIGDLLRRSIHLKADFWESHLELGLLLSKQRKFPEAAAELVRSASLNPKEPLPHYHLARVYDRLGQPDKARAERELHQQLSAVNNK